MSNPIVQAASERARFGCKGSNAPAWLSSLGLDVPSCINEWRQSPDGHLVAQLGLSEFLVEAFASQQTAQRIARQISEPSQRQSGLIAVPRQDHVLDISGSHSTELLAQICNVDFRPHARTATETTGSVILTMMMGVATTVVPRQAAGGLVFTLWIDPSFATYFNENLMKIIHDIYRDTADGTI